MITAVTRHCRPVSLGKSLRSFRLKSSATGSFRQKNDIARMSGPIPVILCGKTTQVGKPASEYLKPEYEGTNTIHRLKPLVTNVVAPVIHFIMSKEAGHAELPILLSGKEPQPASTNEVGSHDYTKPPQAVILGRGFNDNDIEFLRKTCEGVSAVPWIKSGPKKLSDMTFSANYAAATVEKIKVVLAGLKEGDGMGRDGVYEY